MYWLKSHLKRHGFSLFQVADNFIPPLLEAVLLDYKRNVPLAREPEVLSTMATIVNKLENHITKDIPQIFDAVFECTLEMINKDFEEFPEHRTNFFLLLQSVNSHCFQGKLLDQLLPNYSAWFLHSSVIAVSPSTSKSIFHISWQLVMGLLKTQS